MTLKLKKLLRKKQRKNENEVYYVWICRTKSEKGSRTCDAKTIPEKTLKNACAEVLGLEEFNENIFLDQIEHIEPIGTDQLDFYFYDMAMSFIKSGNLLQEQTARLMKKGKPRVLKRKVKTTEKRITIIILG